MDKDHEVFEGTLEEISQQMAAKQAAETSAPGPTEQPISDPPVTQDTTTQTEQFDKYKFLGETFSTEFKGDDDFNAWKSNLTEKVSKFDEVQKQFEQAQNELKAINPRKFFASDDDYIANQLKIKYPDLNPKVLSTVLTSDMTTLDPISAIAYKELMNDPKKEVFASEEQAFNYVCKKLGYDRDIPFADQDEDVQVAVKAAAKEAKGIFGKLKSEVEVPQTIDMTAKQAEANANYEKLKPLVQRDLQSVTAGLEKIDFTVKTKDGKTNTILSFDMGDFKDSKIVKDTLNEVLEYTARNAREWTPEIAKKATEAIVADLRKDYIAANIGHILQAHEDKLTKDFMDRKFEKENNSRSLNPDVTNPNMTEEQKKSKSIKDQFKQDAGLTGKRTFAP